MTLAQTAALWAGLQGALGVALGAFGAHALKNHLTPSLTTVWQTASHYHLLHAVALAATSALLTAEGGATSARPWLAWLTLVGFALGTVLFSGSLYALALGAPRLLGIVTPLGGILLIVGWLGLALMGGMRL